MYAGGGGASGCPRSIHLGSHISDSLQRIFLKLHRSTKIGTINRVMEMNFCSNEGHKKSQFCVTSPKSSIGFAGLHCHAIKKYIGNHSMREAKNFKTCP